MAVPVMTIQFTNDQKAFIRQAIASGRLHHEDDAIKEALALWEERERTRAEILVAVDEAETSVVSGQTRVVTEDSVKALAEDLKRRGRARDNLRSGLRSFPVGEYLILYRTEGDDALILRVVRSSRNAVALWE